jgi:hypothetical protein
VFVVDGTAGVYDEGGTGRVLHLIEPLPVRDDRPTDDQVTQCEYDTRAVVLEFSQRPQNDDKQR